MLALEELKRHPKSKENDMSRSLILTNLGSVYKNLGMFTESIKANQASVEIRRELFGDKNILTAESKLNLGAAKAEGGEKMEALKLMTEALEIF